MKTNIFPWMPPAARVLDFIGFRAQLHETPASTQEVLDILRACNQIRRPEGMRVIENLRTLNEIERKGDGWTLRQKRVT